MEENILELVRLLELEGFYFNIYGKKRIMYYNYSNMSLAICSHHPNKNLNCKVCVTTCNDWDNYIINLPIPVNTRQRMFVIEKILEVFNGINIPIVTEYNLNIYGFR